MREVPSAASPGTPAAEDPVTDGASGRPVPGPPGGCTVPFGRIRTRTALIAALMPVVVGLSLPPGETLFLFDDRVTEAEDGAGFVAGAVGTDDITVLAVRRASG